jgi:SAM-dependent methyltransferase
MEIRDATELLRDAVGDSRGTWADFGAGVGTFTRALAMLLGPGSTIYAVDQDPHAWEALRDLASKEGAFANGVRIVAVQADFSRPDEMPVIAGAALDGILCANALHFVRDSARVLAELVERLRPGGRAVIVEYDRRTGSRWVPFPIPASRWPELAAESGLVGATITATRPSAYQGILYVGAATRP